MSMMSDFVAERRPATVPGMGRLPSRGGGRGLVVLAGVGTLALAALMLAGLLDPEAEAPQPSAPPPPGWEEIVAPAQRFTLDSAEFGHAPALYEARRHLAGGGRQDFLTFGANFATAPYLRLALYQVGEETAPRVDFFVDLTRTAALAGLSVIRSTLPQPQATRFGAFDVAELGVTDGASERMCLGFRFRPEGADLRLAGFACAAEKVLDRNQLACVLDRLEPAAGLDDPRLAAVFADARAAADQGCAPPRAGVRNIAAPQKVLPVTRKGAVPAGRTALD